MASAFSESFRKMTRFNSPRLALGHYIYFMILDILVCIYVYLFNICMHTHAHMVFLAVFGFQKETINDSSFPSCVRYRYLSINLAAILVANLYVMNDMLKALGRA